MTQADQLKSRLTSIRERIEKELEEHFTQYLTNHKNKFIKLDILDNKCSKCKSFKAQLNLLDEIEGKKQ